MRIGTALSVAAGLGTLFVLLVPPWHAPVAGHQLGFRASSMIQFDPTVARSIAINTPPAAPPDGAYGVPAAQLADTRPVEAAYPDVQATKGITAGQFMTMHVATTSWVAPQQGCAFCHAGTDYKADTKPQFKAARVMTGMVRTINADWQQHVAPSGVTCYTCHRGQNIPPVVWFPEQQPNPNRFIAVQEPWHESASTVRDFFPTSSFEEYLLQDTRGRGQSYTALPTSLPGAGPRATIVVKRLYEMMMQMSDGIGVNCGFCHNSRAFFDWKQSTPNRWVGLSGIRMTRTLNHDIILPLLLTMPQTRETVNGGNPPVIPAKEAGLQNGDGLVNCETCHYQAPKPLEGRNMVQAYPGLTGAHP